MPELCVLVAAGLTSVAAYAVARRMTGLSPDAFRLALWRTLECVGASLVFLAVNVLVEVGLVLLVRLLTGRFVSLYYASDLMIVPISCLQGLAVCWWKDVSRRVAAAREAG